MIEKGIHDCMDKIKHIAVLITVHNRKNKTLTCLEKLFAQTLPDRHILEVYLTDDGCTDGTPEAIRKLYPQVNIINGDGSLYWNRGMYRAWQEAAKKNYDFYLWLNDDTYLYDGSLACLLEASLSKQDTAIIVGATESSDHKAMTYGGEDCDGKLQPVDGILSEIVTFNGNIVLIPALVYARLGNLNHYYIHNRGDTDYGIRAMKAGLKSFQAGKVLGMCNRDCLISWRKLPNLPLSERIKLILSHKGYKHNEMFHLYHRQHGLCKAIFLYFDIWIYCLCPNVSLRVRVWKKKFKSILRR